MWLVSQANSVILEVKVEPNSIGQQCLEKVCEKLEIGAEADYFGLRVCSGSGPGRWLNLRNHMDPHRIPSRRLDLRVKFWVPPHLLINEPTRHQFYLHAKLDLIEGRLVVADQEVARRLIAYIAQAETGDCEPDAPTHVYDEYHKIGPMEKPEEHMAKIIEYHCEIAGMRASQAEYRLLKEISKLESFGEELFFCKPVNLSNNAYNLYSHLLYHRQQVEEPRARDEQEIDGGATVGCLATGQSGGGCGCRLSTCVGVGPHGIVVYRPACNGEQDIGVEKQSIPYTAIHRAQPLRRMFQMTYVTGEGHEATLHVKMATSGQAAALYRAVTEKHAFYCCETVRTDVTEQFIRDLKGTIASIFNDASTLGRRYVFDIRRTCREVHDRARRDAHALLRDLAGAGDLILEGETLEACLRAYEEETVELLQRCSGVVVARCSPTQKARVVRLLRARGLVVAAVGDGGNDVAMIQEADIGVGIEGLEGRAASLAGDVSVRAFSALARLLLLHGRRALMRSAALCLFIVHRGLIVSTMQAVFSVVFYFSSVSLYPGFLMVGYGTVFTMLPVFSLVLDKDISSITALKYPQLYKQMTNGRQLSYKTFYIWIGISIYQGGVIMYGALVLFEEQLIHIVEISYTALILTELIMVALTVVTWHRLMMLAELISLLMYTATLLIFTTYFDADFIKHWEFWWKVTAITLVSCLPLYIVKYMHRKWSMRQYKNIRN